MSINGQIPEMYDTIVYSTSDEIIAAIQHYEPCCLFVKRDFESVFTHIPVALMDSPLLGFEWQGKSYAERYLPFHRRTGHYLFNLFAEVYHWILANSLKSQGLQGEVIHDLDDVLIVLTAYGKPNQSHRVFTDIWKEVGLTIKGAKSEEGTGASFGGVELDSAKRVIPLPTSKLVKAYKRIEVAVNMDLLTLVELQTPTGYLNFVCFVSPLGQPFYAGYTICRYTSQQEGGNAEDGYLARATRTWDGGSVPWQENQSGQLSRGTEKPLRYSLMRLVPRN